jgi:putative transposase
VISDAVDVELKKICFQISSCYEIEFIEIGADADHVHFLIQTVPDISPTELARTIKSITAREIFKRVPDVKMQLWGGAFWSSGIYINTVSQHGNEKMIKNYVAN